MSWFYLRFGSATDPVFPSLPHAQHQFDREGLFVAAGGPDVTCIFHSDEAGSGFVVCGAGLLDDGRRVRLMNVNDWKEWLRTKVPDVASLGGHFACVTWSNEGIRFFNDALGIREIFFDRISGGLTVSTHLNLIAQTREANTLNTSSFSGKWYLYIQSDHGSPTTEIDRLGPSGHGAFTVADGLKINRTPSRYEYQTSPDKQIANEITEKIGRYTRFPIENGSRTTLALSGGVDSRLILAALNDQPRDRWNAFTFGHESDADVRVARLLSNKLGFALHVVEPPVIDHGSAIDFVISTDIFKPISGAYAHLSYHLLDAGIIIDGAPGELLRRRLFTKLEYFGAKAIEARRWDEVAKYLWAERPNIWNDELSSILRQRAIEQVHLLCESMPASSEIGIGNWIDTMFCRLWFANTSGADQRRIDGIALSTSPFSQPSMLRDVFRASERYRKSGKLAKDVLTALSKQMARYPYAKDEVIFPAWTPWYVAKLYGKLAKKRSPVLTDQSRFLQEFKMPILDRLNSQAVRECTLYDQKRLHRNVNAYYSGEHQHAAFVDWWYSFEVWRAGNRVSDWS